MTYNYFFRLFSENRKFFSNFKKIEKKQFVSVTLKKRKFLTKIAQLPENPNLLSKNPTFFVKKNEKVLTSIQKNIKKYGR